MKYKNIKTLEDFLIERELNEGFMDKFLKPKPTTKKYNIQILKNNNLLNTKEIDSLMSFISLPMSNTTEIFNIFKSLPNAIYRDKGEGTKKRFVYIEGTRKDKVLMVAHADTIFDYQHIGINVDKTHNPIFDGEVIKSGSRSHSIGADDRCGVTMCYLLKDSGHSILIVDGEEPGAKGTLIGSSWLANENKDILEKINKDHCFMVQFDRRNYGEYKTYDIGSEPFDQFIESSLGLYKPDNHYYTDICVLSNNLCGVNVSVGYYNEHTGSEYVDIKEWYDSFKKYEGWLLGTSFMRYETTPREDPTDFGSGELEKIFTMVGQTLDKGGYYVISFDMETVIKKELFDLGDYSEDDVENLGEVLDKLGETELGKVWRGL